MAVRIDCIRERERENRTSVCRDDLLYAGRCAKGSSH